MLHAVVAAVADVAVSVLEPNARDFRFLDEKAHPDAKFDGGVRVTLVQLEIPSERPPGAPLRSAAAQAS